MLRKLVAGSVLAVLLAAAPTQASVTINRTRVIYPLDEHEVTVRLHNDSAHPSLVQVWIDAGDPNAAPGEAEVPFVATPPIFRMSARKSQMLRLIYTGDALPSRHESVFWLNVLDIPPRPGKAAPADANLLQFAFRTRIKIFARPGGLEGSPMEAPSQLVWELAETPGTPAQVLRVTNPTPYHVSFSEFSVDDGGQTFINDRGAMVLPHATTTLEVPRMRAVGKGAVVRFMAIGDHSTPLPGQAPLRK